MPKSLRYISAAVTIAISLGVSVNAFANTTTSSIRGNVAADTGELFANASITITHTPSGTVSTTTTNASGSFSARSLAVWCKIFFVFRPNVTQNNYFFRNTHLNAPAGPNK